MAGEPSVTIIDILIMDKENCFNIFYMTSYKSLNVAVSFNSTKEAISSVTLYSSSIPLIKMSN